MSYDAILFAFLVFVIGPLFFWWRVKYINKKKDTVRVQCKSCGFVQRLPHVDNYTCKKCGTHNEHRDVSGDIIMGDSYECQACGEAVPEGVVSCTYCGKYKR